MHQTNIQNIDLNLLKALAALLETASVSKAAERVHLSQPAMSRALNRLQQTIKDPLLVRSGRGMVLTPRAEALRQPVRDAIAQVSQVFAPQAFDPAQAQGRFRIMAPDYLAQLIMAPVLRQTLRVAPGIQVEMENLSATGINDLCNGQIALGFGVVDDGPPLENVVAQALFTDRFVCLMRKDHPIAASPLSIDEYANAAHAMLSITGKGTGRLDDILKEHGLRRRIAVRIAHFLTIRAIVATTDVLITVPERLAQLVLTPDLITRPLPKELQLPPFTISQIWHQRFTTDPAHQWLRQLVKSTSDHPENDP